LSGDVATGRRGANRSIAGSGCSVWRFNLAGLCTSRTFQRCARTMCGSVSSSASSTWPSCQLSRADAPGRDLRVRYRLADKQRGPATAVAAGRFEGRRGSIGSGHDEEHGRPWFLPDCGAEEVAHGSEEGGQPSPASERHDRPACLFSTTERRRPEMSRFSLDTRSHRAASTVPGAAPGSRRGVQAASRTTSDAQPIPEHGSRRRAGPRGHHAERPQDTQRVRPRQHRQRWRPAGCRAPSKGSPEADDESKSRACRPTSIPAGGLTAIIVVRKETAIRTSRADRAQFWAQSALSS